jgi:hypothetical protein
VKKTIYIIGTLIFLISIVHLISDNPLRAQSLEYMGSTLWAGMIDVRVAGDYAYCSFVNGLMILNVTDSTAPAFVSQLHCPGRGRGIDVSGSYAYLADEGVGLSIVNVTDPYGPVPVSSFPVAGIREVFVDNRYAFVVNYLTSMEIVDIGDPTQPSAVATYYGAAVDVFVRDNYAYVLKGQGELDILSLYLPDSVVSVGTLSTGGTGNHITVCGNYAYLTKGEINNGDSLQIADISDPANPCWVGACHTGGKPLNVTVEGGYAYVSNVARGLQIFDVSDPAAPSLIADYGSIFTPCNGIWKAGSLVYIVNEILGLLIYDVTDPGNALSIGRYEIASWTWAIATSGQYAYVPGIDYSGPSRPTFSVVDLSDVRNLRVVYYLQDDAFIDMHIRLETCSGYSI